MHRAGCHRAGRTAGVTVTATTFTYAYDANGNVTAYTEVGLPSVSTEYDGLGWAIAVTDGAGHMSRVEYGDTRFPYAKTMEIGLDGRQTGYTYDSHGNITRIVR